MLCHLPSSNALPSSSICESCQICHCYPNISPTYLATALARVYHIILIRQRLGIVHTRALHHHSCHVGLSTGVTASVVAEPTQCQQQTSRVTAAVYVYLTHSQDIVVMNPNTDSRLLLPLSPADLVFPRYRYIHNAVPDIELTRLSSLFTLGAPIMILQSSKWRTSSNVTSRNTLNSSDGRGFSLAGSGKTKQRARAWSLGHFRRESSPSRTIHRPGPTSQGPVN